MKKLLILILYFIFITQLFFFQFLERTKFRLKKLEWSKNRNSSFLISTLIKEMMSLEKLLALMTEEAYYYLKEDFKTPIRNRISHYLL